MICSCPKCHGQIELDNSKIPENGTFMPCPECKGRFWVNRETSARMALRKEGKTYCDNCSTELDRKIVCTGCGAIYPDYLLIQLSKPPRRQIEKAGFSSGFTLKPKKQKYDYSYKTYTEDRKPTIGVPRANWKLIGTVATIVLLIAGGLLYYKNKQVEHQFALNYLRALYAIKTGSDLSIDICNKVSTDWKSSGLNIPPHISREDEYRLNKVKTATDNWLNRINKTPRKFVASKNKLNDLYKSYTKVYELAVSPSGNMNSYLQQTSTSENELKKAFQDIKGSMPPELTGELKVAQTKYKSLNDI